MSKRDSSQHDSKSSDSELVHQAYAAFLKALPHVNESFDHLKSTKKVSTHLILEMNKISEKMREIELVFEKEFAPGPEKTAVNFFPERRLISRLIGADPTVIPCYQDYEEYCKENGDGWPNENKNRCPNEDKDECMNENRDERSIENRD